MPRNQRNIRQAYQVALKLARGQRDLPYDEIAVGGISHQLIRNYEPSFAHQHAQQPIREPHHAQHRFNYLRTLARHPGKLAVQLEVCRQ